MVKHGRLMGMLFLGLLSLATKQLSAQGVATPGEVCKPASERIQDVGCWIMADDPVGQLTKSQVFWHLDAYSTRAAAQADKGPQGTDIETLGKVWLMTIEDANGKPAHGNRSAEIGPVPIRAGETYSVQYRQANRTRGM